MMRFSRLRRVASTLAVCAAAVGLTAVAAPGVQAVDFSGKRVTILVPFSEGGGTDLWTRMMAPYLEKTLPGNPKVLVVNKPGAAGITGANFYNERAPKDGTEIFALSVSTAMNYALEDPRFKFNLTEYHPVLSSPRGSVNYLHRDLGVHEIEGLKEKVEKLHSIPTEKLTWGGRTPGSVDLPNKLAYHLLGLETNNVWGLGGTGPMVLGFERGELLINQENSLAYPSARAHLIEAGIAHAFFTNGVLDGQGNFVRDPALPDVPTFIEVYKAYHGKEPSGIGFESWKIMTDLSNVMNKTLLLHKDVPADVVEVWRKAVRDMLKDEEFLKSAAAELGPYEQIIGEPIRKIMESAFNIPAENRKYLYDYAEQKFDAKLGGRQ